MSNKIQTIVLEDDIIEIFYNANLSNNPYLIRFMNYDNMRYEIRANENDIRELSEILNKIVDVDSRNRVDNADTL
jgi:hypothetical protein